MIHKGFNKEDFFFYIFLRIFFIGNFRCLGVTALVSTTIIGIQQLLFQISPRINFILHQRKYPRFLRLTWYQDLRTHRYHHHQRGGCFFFKIFEPFECHQSNPYRTANKNYSLSVETFVSIAVIIISEQGADVVMQRGLSLRHMLACLHKLQEPARGTSSHNNTTRT